MIENLEVLPRINADRERSKPHHGLTLIKPDLHGSGKSNRSMGSGERSSQTSGGLTPQVLKSCGGLDKVLDAQ